MPTHLLLVRHGETAFNRAGRVQGWIDEPLNESGLQQAGLIAQRLRRETVHAIYSSDLRRAYLTAETIGRALNLPISADARLREHRLGELEGLNGEEMRARFPQRVAQQAASSLRVPAPGEEPMDAFVARVRACVDEIVVRHPEQTVLLVTHGGALHSLLVSCLCMDINANAFFFDNTSLSKVSFDGKRFRVYFLNDTNHLSGSTVL